MATTPNRDWPTPDDTDLVRDGAAAIRALGDAIDGSVGQGFVYAGTRYYTSSGAFEKADPFDDGNPTGLVLRAIRVRLVGGGGGGGGIPSTSSSESAAGDGGGGGGYSEKFYLASELDASETVQRGGGGAGGIGDANGQDGGDSTFKGQTGDGGRGGDKSGASDVIIVRGLPGSGGPASGGDLNIEGNTGLSGVVVRPGAVRGVLQGMGGASLLSGTPRQEGVGGAGASAGRSGIAHGGGGNGAAARGAAPAANGGSGADGIVIIDCFV